MNMTNSAQRDGHSPQGALPGEHPGRSRNPVIKVVDIAWLEFEKPDLTRAEAFARAFGFHMAQHGPDEVQLRGTLPGRAVRDPASRTEATIRRRGVPGRRRGGRAAVGRRITALPRGRYPTPSAASPST